MSETDYPGFFTQVRSQSEEEGDDSWTEWVTLGKDEESWEKAKANAKAHLEAHRGLCPTPDSVPYEYLLEYRLVTNDERWTVNLESLPPHQKRMRWTRTKGWSAKTLDEPEGSHPVARVTQITLSPSGDSPIFAEDTFVVSIQDEAAGEYVEIEWLTDSQNHRPDGSCVIAIVPEQWLALKSVINRMVHECRKR